MPTHLNLERRAAVAATAWLLCAPTLARAQAAGKKLHIGILVGDVPAQAVPSAWGLHCHFFKGKQ